MTTKVTYEYTPVVEDVYLFQNKVCTAFNSYGHIIYMDLNENLVDTVAASWITKERIGRVVKPRWEKRTWYETYRTEIVKEI